MNFLKLFFYKVKSLIFKKKTDLDKSVEKIDHKDPYIYE
jgi:hypothetical protein